MSDAFVQLIRAGRRADILLDRADKHNAASLPMWRALDEALEQIETAGDCGVVVLRSASLKAFCAGADIEEAARAHDDAVLRTVLSASIRNTLRRLAALPVPTIASIGGLCVGAGCGLALACDIRVADETARMGITPAKLGLYYNLEDTKRLVDQVGAGKAKLMLMSGRLFDAPVAQSMGLIDLLVPASDRDGQVDTLCHDILANAAATHRRTKQTVTDILAGHHEDQPRHIDWFTDAFAGADFAAGLAAFRARKPARFPSNGS